MAEKKNPLSERVQKMAAIIEAAKKAGEKAKQGEAKERPTGTAQPSLPAE
jgi:hypothetical protein